jgi:hypothetical protein
MCFKENMFGDTKNVDGVEKEEKIRGSKKYIHGVKKMFTDFKIYSHGLANYVRGLRYVQQFWC